MRLLAFDLETTGLDPFQDRIMEFCFIEVDASLAPRGEPYTALIDPGVAVPAKVEQVTGICTADVAGKPPFSSHAPRIQRLVQDAVLIAHNHRFDVPFLHQELVRAGQKGLDANHPAIDTCSIERLVNSHSLEATYRRYTGKDLTGAHRSRADAEATLEVLRRQLQAHEGVLGTDAAALTQRGLARLRDPDAEERVWLDHAHRFYEDEQGVARFGFGRHRGEPVHEHEGFLNWMTTRDFPEDTLVLVRRFLDAIRKPQATLGVGT